MTGSKEAQLSRAAKALVEAASTEADSMAQKQLFESLDSLKYSFQKELSVSTKSTNDLAKKFEDKINTVNQNIDKLFSEVKISNALAEKQLAISESQQKIKRLERAIANRALESFKYYHSISRSSADLVEKILGYFMFDYGYIIPRDARIVGGKTHDQERKIFRDALVKQIKFLIGREPRLVHNDNGKCTIFYE